MQQPMSSPAGGISQGNEGSPRCLVEAETTLLTSASVCVGGGAGSHFQLDLQYEKAKDKKEYF